MNKEQVKEMIEKRCVNFIMCTNSECKYYWEDMCTKNVGNEIVHIDDSGKCEDFEQGECDWYKEMEEEE
ncbi:hypothetical protein [Vallitalea guaymasensis]|uniref:hypothetical protein n=1 Tax=Vallitalea guaymasensis TaxID=1185412 RepID=UPI000DE3E8C6|nr:hypothetical protein [Vallitalea guaymasensis]